MCLCLCRQSESITYRIFHFENSVLPFSRRSPCLARMLLLRHSIDNETTNKSLQIYKNKMETLAVLCSPATCDALWHGSCTTTYSVCDALQSCVRTKKKTKKTVLVAKWKCNSKENTHNSTSTWGLYERNLHDFHAYTSGSILTLCVGFDFHHFFFSFFLLPHHAHLCSPVCHSLVANVDDGVAPRWQTITRCACVSVCLRDSCTSCVCVYLHTISSNCQRIVNGMAVHECDSNLLLLATRKLYTFAKENTSGK